MLVFMRLLSDKLLVQSRIFVYMGAEFYIVNGFNFCGFMMEKAPHFYALLLYIEVSFIYKL